MKYSKDEMLHRIDTADKNLELGIAALGLLMDKDCYPILEQLDFLCGDEEFFFKRSTSDIPPNSGLSRKYRLENVANDMKSKSHSEKIQIQMNFFKMLLNTPLKETFEAIKHYCNSSNQQKLFTDQPWYNLARIIRNSLTHNYKLKVNKPVKWRDINITKEMDNSYFEVSHVTIIQMLELVKEMKEFAENTLT